MLTPAPQVFHQAFSNEVIRRIQQALDKIIDNPNRIIDSSLYNQRYQHGDTMVLGGKQYTVKQVKIGINSYQDSMQQAMRKVTDCINDHMSNDVILLPGENVSPYGVICTCLHGFRHIKYYNPGDDRILERFDFFIGYPND